MNYSDKKIIFVTGSLCDGGAERVMSILSSGCAELGADVTLVVLRDKKRVYSVSEKVRCIVLESTGSFVALKRIRQLHRVFKHSEAETIIPFVQIVTLYTLIANIGVGKRIIMSERADPKVSIFSRKLSIKDKVGKFLMQYMGLHKLAYRTVFQTPDAKAWYCKKIQRKSVIIPNPLDTDSLPQRFIGEREKRIVAAGRFSPEKNFPMLIRGFSVFHETHPEYTLTIYGDGKDRGRLEALVDSLGLAKYVEMPGFSKSLQRDIRAAAIYVSTSNHEGISNSMLEALGMGIPTIVTDCPVGGARMFVHTDENGVLIPMNDVDALVAALNKIVTDQAYAVRISKEAANVREDLCREKICEQWLELV